MAVVKNLTDLKSVGMFTAFPDTIIIAIVSPIVRPRLKKILFNIPFFADGMVTLKIVLISVSPKANEDSLTSRGTALKESTEMLMIVGKIITDNTKIAVSKQSPTVLPKEMNLTIGTIISIPKKP
jgi:hypothetical protein